MAITTDLAILTVGAGIMFYAAQSIEYKLLAKWIFLFTFLLTVFQIYITLNTDLSLEAYLIGMLGLVVFLFIYDLVVTIPEIMKVVRNQMRR